MSPTQDDPDAQDWLVIDALIGEALDDEDADPERGAELSIVDRASEPIDLDSTQVAGLDRLQHAIAETLGREWMRRLDAARAARALRGGGAAGVRPRGALLARLAVLRERYPSVVARHPAAADGSDASISQVIEDVEAVTGDGES